MKVRADVPFLLISQPRNAEVPPTGEPVSETKRKPAMSVLSVVTAVKFALSSDITNALEGLGNGLLKPIACVEYNDEL